jgi:hypothetical protein
LGDPVLWDWDWDWVVIIRQVKHGVWIATDNSVAREGITAGNVKIGSRRELVLARGRFFNCVAFDSTTKANSDGEGQIVGWMDGWRQRKKEMCEA